MRTRFAVVSDIHYPFEDSKAVKAFIKYIKKNPVDVLIFNGDILDMYDVSKFSKSPDRIQCLQQEINKATALFKKCRSLLPEAKLIFIQGNHEFRLERYLENHSELWSLDCLKLPNLLKLDKYNIQYEPDGYKLGSLYITHGSCVSKYSGVSARMEMEKNDSSGISGHTHRGGSYYKKTPSRYLGWFEGFCLCDINPHYLKSPNWQQGFLTGWIEKDSFAVNPVPIVDGDIKI